MIDGLIEIEKLLTVLLYDEPTDKGRLALRLVGYSASRVPWGVRFGGPEQCRFFKDLSLQPVPQARGYRLDLASANFCNWGSGSIVKSNVIGDTACGKSAKTFVCPNSGPDSAHDVEGITGDGPEVADYARRTGKSVQRLMEQLRRNYFGLTLHPLAWVSHHWQQAAAIFADMTRFPRRQVFSLNQLPGNLIGFQGAAEFNFLVLRQNLWARSTVIGSSDVRFSEEGQGK